MGAIVTVQANTQAAREALREIASFEIDVTERGAGWARSRSGFIRLRSSPAAEASGCTR